MVRSRASRTTQASALTGPMLSAVRFHYNQGQHRVAGVRTGLTDIEFRGPTGRWTRITGRRGQGSHSDTFEFPAELEITGLRVSCRASLGVSGIQST